MPCRIEGVRRLALTCLVLLSAQSALAGAAKYESPVYARRDTWSQTMIETRARYAAWIKQHTGDRQAAGQSRPFTSDALAGTGPAKHISVDVSGWPWLRLATVMEQRNGNCHIWGEAKLIGKDGSVTPLSSLKPVSVKVGWGQLLTDRNWQNEPLKIGNKTFPHGLWVHADSDVCYALQGNYERFEAWIGLDAARAEGQARFTVTFGEPDILQALWQATAADFPLQTRWFVEDGGRRPGGWFFDARDIRPLQSVIQRLLDSPHAPSVELRRQFAELREARAPIDDVRWLDLYVRARRHRDCQDSLRQLWLTDLRQPFEREAAALLQAGVSPDDARWEQLATRLAALAERLGRGRAADARSLRRSLDELAQAMPARFPDNSILRSRLDREAARWQAVCQAVAQGDESALAQLARVGQEVEAFRREIVLTLRGMREFLDAPAHVGLVEEWERQFATLEFDLLNRAHFERVAPETFRPQALVLAADRDPADVVLRRTEALLDALKRRSSSTRVAALAEELKEIKAAAARLDPTSSEARFVLFADACRVRRQVAFANPLLNFDQILFIKRHRALFNHMCDQYYGMAATPGGGLYVLSNPFGPAPRVHDVLADAVVERGRLRGQKLGGGPTTPPTLSFDGMGNRRGEDVGGGTFLSPDLSYDGRSVLFAYVENQGSGDHRHHTDPTQGHWAEGRCFHVFKVRLDGSGLEQLTDGTWNDFDPCWLPNGRIAFISERRGGYLRCGRVCPTYTLFDMAADGSDVKALSFHETNEWHPSVTHDGSIIWTRWDYVDRHGCTAHMPWLTTLDGRDPRPVHGNYAPRPSRPDMELDCRAIPSSRKFVATAAPHHGQAYGSLVIVDPQVADDDGMGPVKRITPEIGFPETQGGAQVYGSAWPLDEDYYLCVYDANMQPGIGFQGGRLALGNYGIYLVDSFGNKELIYRDPEIGCLSPIPVVPRPVPGAAVELAKRGLETNPANRPLAGAGTEPAEGTVAVINVYDGQKPWPTGTKIRSLRVLQVLPMSVPSGGPPHETALRVATAGDSVVPVRHVLGTVPVEDDGSAHFSVPANVEFFFQALDEEGLAVQSMRSATQLQRGERLVCAGCHEPKHRVARAPESVPQALRRPPSRLRPDVDGSNPFSYPRLVQPVLDRHCVECHTKESDKAPNLGREPYVRNWFASYNNLVHRYGFYDYGDAYRTTPGKFGARASKLYEILQKGHYDVKLTQDEMHRLTLWLDCSSMFYGVYEKEGGAIQLRGGIARATLE